MNDYAKPTVYEVGPASPAIRGSGNCDLDTFGECINSLPSNLEEA